MREKLKLGAIVSAVCLSAVFAAFRAAPAVVASNESRASPRSLYVQNCARCHGADGTSQTALGRKLQADDLTSDDVRGDSTAKIIRVVTNGKGDMPGFKKKLTAAQIASIANYVHSL